MSSSSTFSLPDEQSPHLDTTNTRDRSNSVGTILDALRAFRSTSNAISSSKSSPATQITRLTYYPTTKVFFFGKFVVESTGLSNGWRVTTTDTTTGVQRNFYVHSGQIHHINFHAPAPWNHSTPFVVGRRVKRITDSEMRAIRRAIG
jgi:hypothetical protein